MSKVPKWLVYVGLVMVILAMIPPSLIARTRAVPSERRRIHLVQDMDNQHKFRAQQASVLFADGRAMRPPVVGTVARGELKEDDHYHRGIVLDGAGQPQWATAFPQEVPLSMPLMLRGQERFTIYCRPCHGDAAYGDGIVHKRAMELVVTGTNGTVWVQPKSLHEPAIRVQPPGQVFNTITHGIRNMAGYESQIPAEDRWAIVAYVKALQRSQSAKMEDVPEELRGTLPLVPLTPEELQMLEEARQAGSFEAGAQPAGQPGSEPAREPGTQPPDEGGTRP